MDTRAAASFVSALAATGCLLLSGCTDSTSEPEPSSSSASAGIGVIASESPTVLPAPDKSDGVAGVEVELSSSTSIPGEPVQVTVTVPKKLAKESVVLVSPAADGALDLITAPVQVNEDLQAFVTLDMGRTMTFRAIVPKDDVSDASTLPEGAPILGQSEDFTITVE